MKYSLLLVLIIICQTGLPLNAEPALLLANVYHRGIVVKDYWVSEKLDGVRAYWDGKHLVSRRGNRFSAPEWFTANFPSIPLDGELWMGRNQFEAVSGAVRRRVPNENHWRKIRFMVFDMPGHNGTFDQRINAMNKLAPVPYLEIIEQYKVANQASLEKDLDQNVVLGGEGLMLHRGASFYHAGRNDDLLKFKRYQDAEARVIAYVPGNGKFQGLMGSLVMESPEGMRFKIGTGFTNSQRREPPDIGSTITYKYFGRTINGVPKFASFLRVRKEQ